MKIDILKLEAKNVARYKKLGVDFSNGLVLVFGENLDSFDSNGSGKSTIFECIYYGLYGKFIRGENLRPKSKTMEISLCVEVDGVPLTINRTVKPTSKKIELVYGGKIITKDITNTMAQERLQHIIGLTPQVFLSAVLFQGTDHRSFAAMTDKEQKELFNSVLRISEWEEYAAEASRRLETKKRRLAEIRVERVRLEAQRDLLDEQLETSAQAYANLEEFPSRDEWLKKNTDDFMSGANYTERDLHELKTKHAELLHELKEYNVRKEIMTETKNAVEHHRRAFNAADNAIKGLEGQLKELKRDMEKAKKGKCPLCGTRVSGDQITQHFLAKMSKISKRLKKEKQDAEEAKKQLELLAPSVDAFDWSLGGELFNKAETLRFHMSEMENMIGRGNKHIEEYKRLLALHNQKAETLKMNAKEAEQKKLDLNGRLDTLYSEGKKAEKARMVASELVRMFGRSGIQSQILRQVEDPLNNVLHDLMKTFGYRQANVGVSPVRELASGELRDQVSVTILDSDNVSRNYKSFSGGERRRLDLVFFFGMNRLMSETVEINLLLVDEALNDLDREGADSLRSVLQAEAKNKCVLVSVPTDSIEWSFDRKLLVRREKGVSKLVV